ncbi:MAG TPA: hypothetical protein DD438_00675 [Verrucomicrobiales bacterium]|nr:hypothetical protein [Verrucomicrobiales bacterium]
MAGGDVRGVLQYVPMFRGRTFVVVFDEGLPESAVAEALLDLKVLQGIGVNLVIAVAGGEEAVSVAADRALDLEIKFARLNGEESVGPILGRGQAAIVRCPADGIFGKSLASLGLEIRATKLIGLLNGPGILRGGQAVRAVSCSMLPGFLDDSSGAALTGGELLKEAAVVCRAGVPRVHILDGRQQGVLADELFSNEGVGTMVHADSYRDVRALREDDVPELLAMIGRSVRASHLVPRDYEEILQKADDFLVLCVDDNVVGCVALHCHRADLAELACLYVKQSHECRGYGKLLVEAAEERASERGIHTIFALTTRAVSFFENLGYRMADTSIVPENRARKCEESERSSAVLAKELG